MSIAVGSSLSGYWGVGITCLNQDGSTYTFTGLESDGWFGTGGNAQQLAEALTVCAEFSDVCVGVHDYECDGDYYRACTELPAGSNGANSCVQLVVAPSPPPRTPPPPPPPAAPLPSRVAPPPPL